MQVSRCCGHGVVTQPLCLFLLDMKMSSSFFVLFWVLFLFKPCKMGDFGCLKDKNRDKNKGKGRGGCEGSRTLFWGGIFGVFWFFFKGIWKRRRIIYNLPAG